MPNKEPSSLDLMIGSVAGIVYVSLDQMKEAGGEDAAKLAGQCFKRLTELARLGAQVEEHKGSWIKLENNGRLFGMASIYLSEVEPLSFPLTD